MDTQITFPYKSRLMRNLKDLLTQAKQPTLGSMLMEALTYQEIYQHCQDLKMHMVSSPFNSTDDLCVIDNAVTDEHMHVCNIDLTLQPEGATMVQAMAGKEPLPDFLTRMLVMYEQVVHARAKGHGIGKLDISDPEHIRLQWTPVISQENQSTGNHSPKPSLH